MSDSDRTSSSPPHTDTRAADDNADLHAKLDRVAGLCAATVTQIDRLTRVLGANQQLDARSKRDHSELMTENRAVLRQVREALAAMANVPRALPAHDDDDDGSGFDGRRRREDNSQITASLKFQIRNSDGEEDGEEKKKSGKKIAVTVVKWVAGLAAGALGHYLIGK